MTLPAACDRPTCPVGRLVSGRYVPYAPRIRGCTGCEAFVCTATPEAPEDHDRCRHGVIVGSSPAYGDT